MTVKDKFKNVWNKIKTPLKVAATAVCFGMLPGSCKNKPQPEREPIKDMAYYYANNLPHDEIDMYGNHFQARLVEIKVYKDASMLDEKNGNIMQVRWGVPKSELNRNFDMQKTHAEYVFLDEVSSHKGWIEVFDNEYGVSVCKDQPCFLVDKNGRLLLVGNDQNYEYNMRRYKRERDEEQNAARLRIEKSRQQYRDKKQNWDRKQVDLMKSQGITDEDTTLIAKNVPPIAKIDSTAQKDTLSIRQPQSSIPVLSDSIKADSINQRGR